MNTVSLFDAKTHLSRIVRDLLSGVEEAVIVSRHGKPVVKIVRFRESGASRRIGAARGRFDVPDNIDALNPAVAELFSVKEDAP